MKIEKFEIAMEPQRRESVLLTPGDQHGLDKASESASAMILRRC